MEYTGTVPFSRELNWRNEEFEPFPNGLDELLASNERSSIEYALPPEIVVEIERGMIRNPLDRRTVFAYLGLMLGTFPPSAFFLLFVFSKGYRSVPLLAAVLLILANATTAIVGFHFGKIVAKMVEYAEGLSIIPRTALSALIGTLWGIVSGFAGGLFLYIIGGICGAFIGGAVGAIALSAFMLPYSAVHRGGSLSLSHFLPMSVGVILMICSTILHFLFF